MAKKPDDRYTTCAALITAAEEALELRRPPALLRHRRTVIAAVATLLILAAVLAAAVLIRGGGNSGVAPPAVKADTLVRIDPATNSGQCGRRRRPETLRDRCWRAQRLGLQHCRSVGLGDRRGNRHRPAHNEASTLRPAIPDAFTGPVLAADTARRLARRRRRARKVLSHAGVLGARPEARVPAAARAACSRGRLRRRLGRHSWRTRQRGATHRPGHRRGHQADALPRPPRRSTVSPPALAASGSWPRPPQCSTGSTLARQP